MAEWHQTPKGNYTSFDFGSPYTVFRNEDGEWQVVHADEFSHAQFDTAETAKAAVEDHLRGDYPLAFKSRTSGWRAAKKGGYYRVTRRGIATVKQTKTGSWFAIVAGELIEGMWFPNREEAQAYVDLNCCTP